MNGFRKRKGKRSSPHRNALSRKGPAKRGEGTLSLGGRLKEEEEERERARWAVCYASNGYNDDEAYGVAGGGTDRPGGMRPTRRAAFHPRGTISRPSFPLISPLLLGRALPR